MRLLVKVFSSAKRLKVTQNLIRDANPKLTMRIPQLRPFLLTASLTIAFLSSGLTAQVLTVDTEAVSLTRPTIQQLSLSGAGVSGTSRNYIILGSISGTSPGTLIGTTLLPLNLDFYLVFTAG